MEVSLKSASGHILALDQNEELEEVSAQGRAGGPMDSMTMKYELVQVFEVLDGVVEKALDMNGYFKSVRDSMRGHMHYLGMLFGFANGYGIMVDDDETGNERDPVKGKGNEMDAEFHQVGTYVPTAETSLRNVETRAYHGSEKGDDT